MICIMHVIEYLKQPNSRKMEMALSFCVHDISQNLCNCNMNLLILNDKEALIGIKILYFMFKNAHSSSLEILLLHVQND